jgi:hypothetical protein
MSDSDANAGVPQLVHASQTPYSRVSAVATLQHDIVEGIGHDLHITLSHDLDHLGGVWIWVAVHRRAVTGQDLAAESMIRGLGTEDLEEARAGIIGLIAVYIDLEAPTARQVQCHPKRLFALDSSSLEVWDGADGIHAHLDDFTPVICPSRSSQDALLWKCDHLQFDGDGMTIGQYSGYPSGELVS